MDIFAEQLVPRKRDGKDILKIAGVIVLASALSVVLFLLLGILSFVPFCGVWFGAYWLVTRTNTEFEYILTSSVLDIDKITARRSRKRIVSIDLKDSVQFAPFETVRDTNGKIIDATPDGNAGGAYAVDFMANGINKRLIFAPNRKILNFAKLASPSVVILRDEDVEE
ncbi:MAG: hypothetical protein IKR46_04815 [Clostridia bacterium]|nr:hypothetical protein [Clostridia bacterium]